MLKQNDYINDISMESHRFEIFTSLSFSNFGDP